jgi:hypothetical protein
LFSLADILNFMGKSNVTLSPEAQVRFNFEKVPAAASASLRPLTEMEAEEHHPGIRSERGKRTAEGARMVKVTWPRKGYWVSSLIVTGTPPMRVRTSQGA